jgi:hypothetical protein
VLLHATLETCLPMYEKPYWKTEHRSGVHTYMETPWTFFPSTADMPTKITSTLKSTFKEKSFCRPSIGRHDKWPTMSCSRLL